MVTDGRLGPAVVQPLARNPVSKLNPQMAGHINGLQSLFGMSGLSRDGSNSALKWDSTSKDKCPGQGPARLGIKPTRVTRTSRRHSRVMEILDELQDRQCKGGGGVEQ